jgi:hypothetical protein
MDKGDRIVTDRSDLPALTDHYFEIILGHYIGYLIANESNHYSIGE